MNTVIHIAASAALPTTENDNTATPANGGIADIMAVRTVECEQDKGFPELKFLPAGHRCRKAG